MCKHVTMCTDIVIATYLPHYKSVHDINSAAMFYSTFITMVCMWTTILT